MERGLVPIHRQSWRQDGYHVSLCLVMFTQSEIEFELNGDGSGGIYRATFFIKKLAKEVYVLLQCVFGLFSLSVPLFDQMDTLEMLRKPG